MNEKTLKYIRKHDYLYWFLRENSSYYREIYQNNDYVYTLKKIAKDYYKVGYSDKMDRLLNKIDIINSFVDVFK